MKIEKRFFVVAEDQMLETIAEELCTDIIARFRQHKCELEIDHRVLLDRIKNVLARLVSTCKACEQLASKCPHDVDVQITDIRAHQTICEHQEALAVRLTK